MSDEMAPDVPAGPAPAATAGGLLRQARKAQGLHIAALAAAIKVSPRKLELLESDQFDQLPDATFTRALAQTMCRALKIDPAPILALMPRPPGHRLEQMSEGLNTPFRERPGQLVPKDWASAATPALVIAALLLVGAAVIYLAPADWLPSVKSALNRAGGDAAVATPAPVTESVTTPLAAASAAMPASAAASVPAASDVMPPVSADTAEPLPPAVLPVAVAGVLQLRPSAPSWVEVIDANGKPLIARLLQADESVGLDGALPMKVKIGNAGATEVVFRGQPLELGPFTRDNMAKLELK
jgi:cytoskeleton protein RodZ